MNVALRLCLIGAFACGATVRPSADPLPPPRYERDPLARAPALPELPDARGDVEIGVDVRRELAALGGPNERGPLPMRVSVESGIVILSGAVPAVGCATRAAERALTVRGTRAVIDQLQVAALPVADAAIEAKVREELIASPAVAALGLSVLSRGGEVQLSGAVGSAAQREIAGDIAARVPGVHAVVNLIAVAARTVRADTEVAAEIRELLQRDPYLAGEPLQVAVRDGVVWLSGSVGTRLQLARARSRAWVTGVQGVELEQLQVEPGLGDPRQRAFTPQLDDRAALAALQVALWLDPRVPHDGIEARVRAGVAKLQGTVPSWLSHRSAEQDAAHVVGIWRVENHLHVANGEPAARSLLVQQLRGQLERHPEIEVGGLELESRPGRIVIRGNAEPLESRVILELLGRYLPGGTRVSSQLQISESGARDRALLERAVQRELWWDRNVDSVGASLEVRGELLVLGRSVADPGPRDAIRHAVLRGSVSRTVEGRLHLDASEGSSSWRLR